MKLWLLRSSLLACLAVTVACGDTIVNVPTTPTPTAPAITKDRVEYHVIGNATGARVKYSSSVEGLNQTTTTLPFQTIISSSSADGAFLYLEATPTGYSGLVLNPFCSVQIFVNGQLFREAATTSSFLETITVSGTYRR